jgi:hypothetical protein
VDRSATAEPKGKALRLAERDHVRGALALRVNIPAAHMDGRLAEQRGR